MEQPITPLDQASCWMRRSDLHASLAWATLGEIQFPVEVDLGVKNRREHWRVMLALLVPRHQVARDNRAMQWRGAVITIPSMGGWVRCSIVAICGMCDLSPRTGLLRNQ
jgi:hypothetical protein